MENDVEAINNSLIVENIQNVIDLLSSEDNIWEFSDEHFNPNDYIKIENSDLTNMLSTTLSAVPSLTSSAMSIVSSEQVNKIAQEGIFKVVFKNGVNDKTINDLYKNSEGFLITSYNSGNGIDQAGLSSVGENISNQASATTTANVVSSIMSVASVVVGCYYMKNINNELNNISQSFRKFFYIINNDKISKLNSIYNFLSKIANEYTSNFLNTSQINSYLYEIVDCRRTSWEIADYYKMQVDINVKDFDLSNNYSKEKEFEENYQEYKNNLDCYQFATTIYGLTYTVETIISNNQRKDFLNSRKNDLQTYITNVRKTCYDWSLNVSSKIKDSKAFIPNLLEMGFILLSALFENKYDEVIKTKQQEIQEKKNNYIAVNKKICVNDECNKGIQLLDKYSREKKYRLCYHNGDVYIDKKYLETEEN